MYVVIIILLVLVRKYMMHSENLPEFNELKYLRVFPK